MEDSGLVRAQVSKTLAPCLFAAATASSSQCLSTFPLLVAVVVFQITCPLRGLTALFAARMMASKRSALHGVSVARRHKPKLIRRMAGFNSGMTYRNA